MTYAIYEKQPQFRKFPNSVVSGSFQTEAEAEAYRLKNYATDNYYVAPEIEKQKT